MQKESIICAAAPAAVGPYSHANVVGNLVFVSGQLPVHENGQLIQDDIGEATRACMRNLGYILKEAGSSLEHCLKCTIYLTSLTDFSEVNKAYSEFFQSNFPARVCVEVSALPKNARIEIDAIASKP